MANTYAHRWTAYDVTTTNHVTKTTVPNDIDNIDDTFRLHSPRRQPMNTCSLLRTLANKANFHLNGQMTYHPP